MKYNLNQYVKVKLTEKGLEHLKGFHDFVYKMTNTPAPEFEINIDDNGYTKMQFNWFMGRFGDLGITLPDYVDLNIILCGDE